MKLKKLILLFLLPAGMALLSVGCDTEADYMQEEGVVPMKVAFKYMADNTAQYAVEYGGISMADTLPYKGRLVSDLCYLKESRLSDTLRVYRLENGGRTLETEQPVTVTPIVVNPSSSDAATISLLQLSADSPVQVVAGTVPADSTAIALQFFYADERQVPEADRVKITILAADQYALLMTNPRYSLDKLDESLKTVVGELELSRGELSGPVELDVNLYEDVNKGLPARFFYKIRCRHRRPYPGLHAKQQRRHDSRD